MFAPYIFVYVCIDKIRSINKANLLSSEPNQQYEITAKSETVNALETFTLINIDIDHVAIKSSNGKYLSFDEKSQQIYATGNAIGNKEKI